MSPLSGVFDANQPLAVSRRKIIASNCQIMAVTKKKMHFFAFFLFFTPIHTKTAILTAEIGGSFFLLHPPMHGGLFSTSPSPRVSAELVRSCSLLAAISASIFRFVCFAGYIQRPLRPFPRH